jgi:hypothetical protein
MAFVVSKTQPPNGQLGDEWFNPTTNELKKLVALNGTTVAFTTIYRAGSYLSNVTSTSASSILVS